MDGYFWQEVVCALLDEWAAGMEETATVVRLPRSDTGNGVVCAALKSQKNADGFVVNFRVNYGLGRRGIWEKQRSGGKRGLGCMQCILRATGKMQRSFKVHRTINVELTQ